MMPFHKKPNTFVDHVNIKVENLERSLSFYQEVIGFSILEQTATSATLTTDGKTSILSIEQPNHVLPKLGRTTGLYHFAILLPHRADLARIVYHFSQLGVRIGSSDHLVSEALYLSDPDGNGIEIYVDREPSQWSWNTDEVAMTVDPLNFKDLLANVKDEQPWKGLPAETVMGHIHLHVADLNKAEEFYTKGLGFDVVNRYGQQALFISTGKYHHHIGLNTWNGVGAPTPPANSVGLESYTLNYSDEEARQRIIANLEMIGSVVTKDNGVYSTVDPSGNRIILGI